MDTEDSTGAVGPEVFISLGKEISDAKEAYETGNPAALLLVAARFISLDANTPDWVQDGFLRALSFFADHYKFDGKNFKRMKATRPDYLSARAWNIAGQRGKAGQDRLEEAQNILATRWNVHRATSSIENSLKEVSKARKTPHGRAQFIELRSGLSPDFERIMDLDGSIFHEIEPLD